MTTRVRAISVLVVLLGSVTTAVAGTPLEISVEPVTLLDAGKIAGCGLKATARADDATTIGEVIAFRSGDVTVFSVRARAVDGAGNAMRPSHIRLTTASHDTRTLFPAPRPHSDGQIETRAHLAGFTGSSFAQELMVMGGRFEVRREDQSTLTFDLPLPMPHTVRQAYLNCAGDLFRPEDE